MGQVALYEVKVSYLLHCMLTYMDWRLSGTLCFQFCASADLVEIFVLLVAVEILVSLSFAHGAILECYVNVFAIIVWCQGHRILSSLRISFLLHAKRVLA